VLFLCSEGDHEEIGAVREASADYLTLNAPPAQGQYAKKINFGYRSSKAEWLFLGADDLQFLPGWAETAIAYAKDRLHVVSTDDKANSFVRMGILATHPLVRRSYIDEQGGSLEGPGSIYHEGYSHNFVDCELTVLARQRGVFGFAKGAVVRHLHPLFKKAPMDRTYELGLKDFMQDRKLFVTRMSDFPRDQLVRKFVVASR
jgi:hypothetical protein